MNLRKLIIKFYLVYVLRRMTPSTFDAFWTISDPKNNYAFSVQAARKAFEKVKL